MGDDVMGDDVANRFWMMAVSAPAPENWRFASRAFQGRGRNQTQRPFAVADGPTGGGEMAASGTAWGDPALAPREVPFDPVFFGHRQLICPQGDLGSTAGRQPQVTENKLLIHCNNYSIRISC